MYKKHIKCNYILLNNRNNSIGPSSGLHTSSVPKATVRFLINMFYQHPTNVHTQTQFVSFVSYRHDLLPCTHWIHILFHPHSIPSASYSFCTPFLLHPIHSAARSFCTPFLLYSIPSTPHSFCTLFLSHLILSVPHSFRI